MVVLKERQLIQEVGDKDMARIEFSGSPEVPCVVSVGDDVALIGAIIHDFAVRVSDSHVEPVGEAAIPLDLQTVIERLGYVVGLANRVVAFEGTQIIEVGAGRSGGYHVG